MPDNTLNHLSEGIESIIKALVDEPEKASVEVMRLTKKSQLILHTGGQNHFIMGREGRTLDALRTLVIAASGKLNTPVYLELSQE